MVRSAVANLLRGIGSLIRRKGLRLIVALAVALLTAVMATLNVGESLRARFFGDATVYAEGFSERKFASVKVGATTAEVLSIMGPPLRRAPFGDAPLVWFYTDQRTSTDNFWRRWVVLDPTGKRVAEIITDFWVD